MSDISSSDTISLTIDDEYLCSYPQPYDFFDNDFDDGYISHLFNYLIIRPIQSSLRWILG